MNIGSIWRRWDLHIHSPLSVLNNQYPKNSDGSPKWDEFMNKLEEINNISVIGITDYFFIDGYKKILEFKKNGRLSNFDLILPNVELRLDTFVVRNKSKDINFHIIFSDELQIEDIEKEFIEALDIELSSSISGLEGIRKLNKRTIQEVGELIKKYNKPSRSDSIEEAAFKNITVSLKQVQKLLRKDLFRGKFLLVLSGGEWADIDWKQAYLTKKNFLQAAHILETGSLDTVNWVLGKKDLSKDEVVNEFGALKPCIFSSDAHSLDKICKPNNNKFCWIKADPTFEGLKQIIYEPEERVKIQPENPEYRKNIYTLSSIKINNSWISDELSIEEQEIQLNSNLIAVIGGKGSGKTALLDLIANCFEDRCKRAGEDENSFIQRIEDQKEDLEVEIGFIGEEIDEFLKKLIEEKFYQDSRITYLPQGKIEEYSGDREKLDKTIVEIIFNNKEVKEGKYKQKFDRLRDEINQFIKMIDEINKEIYNFEEETRKEVIDEIRRKKAIKEGELKDRRDELIEFTKSIENNIKQRVEKLKLEETDLRVKHSIFENIKIKLERFKYELEESLSISNETIDDLNCELSKLLVNFTITKLDFNTQFNEIENILKFITKETKKIIKELKKKERDINQLSVIEKRHVELLKEIENIEIDIKLLKTQLEELNRKKREVNSLENERINIYQDILKKYLEWKEYYKEIINVFSDGKSEIMSGINFESSIYFNKDKFKKIGSDILDQRRININDIEKYADKLENIINESTKEILMKRIRNFINEILKEKAILKETRTNYDLYSWIFCDYFSISTKIFFKNIAMSKLSIGQKGTVLLKLFLAEGDYPLIVDQPEESLDNKFIYDELVGAFRKAKKNRQVIIATNNANLVVNTDAEQIIVAEFKNNEISYNSGSLENLEIREDIMPILEGGEEAFRKREEKYGI